MQDPTILPVSRVRPVTVWIDKNHAIQVCPMEVEIKVNDSVEWIFRAEPNELIEIRFQRATGASGQVHRGPFPPKNDEDNPSEGVFKKRGKADMQTLPAREPAADVDRGWKYDVVVTLASGEVVTLDPIIIVRATSGPDF